MLALRWKSQNIELFCLFWLQKLVFTFCYLPYLLQVANWFEHKYLNTEREDYIDKTLQHHGY